VLKREMAEKEADFEKVMQAYLSADLAEILAVSEKTTAGLVDEAVWEEMKARLIIQRNNAMAKRLIAAAKEHRLFVAVGASHLAGETGLVAQLKAAGFTLKPLQGLADD